MTQQLENSKLKDSSSKLIFDNPVLCTQFFRDYVDIPMLKDIAPEDIEDVTNRYVHMFTEERNSDSVKRIHVKANETPFFLISLIEHKSNVDYNVVMQIFRYMAFIWEDYEKEMEQKQKGISKRKNFKYPPILPVVFYDGAENWTAATNLHERVLFSDIFGKYIPDYQCILVQLKDYSNEELMKKKDELSIIMMVERLKNMADFTKLREEMNADYLTEVLSDSPEYLLKLIQQIVEVFLEKLNVPPQEAQTFTEQIKERKMGELFANLEAWDVQALRKEFREEGREEGRREAREEIRKAQEEAQKEVEKARIEVDEKVRKAQEEARKENEKAQEENMTDMVRILKKLTGDKNAAREQLVETCGLPEQEAVEAIEKYWEK